MNTYSVGLMRIGGLCLVLPLFSFLAQRQDASPHSVSASPSTSSRTHTRIYPEIADLSLEAYARIAGGIVHARVLNSQPHFPKNGFPYTAVDMEIISAFKGAYGRMITVCVGGAEGPDSITHVVGAPAFSAGEEVLVFLCQDPANGRLGVLGLSAGTYRLTSLTAGEPRVNGRHAQDLPLSAFVTQLSTLVNRSTTGR